MMFPGICERICVFRNTQSGGVAMLRLLRLLRVFLIMQRSGDKKRLRRKKGKGVTCAAPSGSPGQISQF